MSYQVLARKWRPKNFTSMVEQSHIVRALTHALDQQRLHHAYLFTGTRGVGKTTLARILAKAFNCETGVTSRPCGVCRACTEIDNGRFVDLIEVDAATNTRVEEMRQLLENAIYVPSIGRFKVYVIDEVHMLSSSAFNAMLKTLEEPPEHIKFILATTDPQKIPVTVLSRCLQFNLKQMPAAAIIEHLEHILREEKIAFELPALRLLAQAAHGSMRDALSLADQAIAYSAGTVTEEAIRGMLGTIDNRVIIRLLDALITREAAQLLAIADEMATRSLSFGRALADMAGLLQRIALAQQIPTAVIEEDPDTPEIMRLASLMQAEEIQLYYQICLHGRNEMSWAPDEYAGFTMTLIRLLAFRPIDSDKLDQPEGSKAATKISSSSMLPQNNVTLNRKFSAEAQLEQAAPVQPASMTPLEKTHIPEQEKTIDDWNIEGQYWPTYVEQIPATGIAKQFLQQCELLRCDGKTLYLRVPIKTLADTSTIEKVTAALNKYLKKNIQLVVEVGAVQGTTAAKVQQSVQTDKLNQATEAIIHDPFINDLVTQFGASIVPNSIKSTC